MYIYSNNKTIAECSSPKIVISVLSKDTVMTSLEFTVFERIEQETVIDLLRNGMLFYDEFDENFMKCPDFEDLYKVEIQHNPNLSQTIKIKYREEIKL